MTDAAADAPLRLLTYTTLYPNAAQPSHGIFVENRLRHLVGSGEARSVVLAPVPYFPRLPAGIGKLEWARYARVPAEETRHGLTVRHPRYLVIPRVGMSAAPTLLARGSVATARRLASAFGPFDAIDAHYVYPDGVAAMRLADVLDLPLVVTARGTDVNLIPQFDRPRRMIEALIRRADALIGVSAAIADALMRLGAPPEKVTVLRNGVDTRVFTPPPDRAAARASLGLTRRTLLSVGHLIERKGHHRTIEALADLPDTELLIAGEGPERTSLTALAARLGVVDRVRLLGQRPHHELAALYGAADVMVLASSREGWANVLLESMACGTPVVASPIWGNPEVVRAPEAGVIAAENTPRALAEAVRTLFAAMPDRAATRIYAEGFSWDETTAGQLALFRRVIAARRAAAAFA